MIRVLGLFTLYISAPKNIRNNNTEHCCVCFYIPALIFDSQGLLCVCYDGFHFICWVVLCELYKWPITYSSDWDAVINNSLFAHDSLYDDNR